MQEYFPGATVHGQKRPGGLRCLGIFLQGEHASTAADSQGLNEQTVGQCYSIYVHLQLLASSENHAAGESSQETCLEVRECATANTCSSSVLWT